MKLYAQHGYGEGEKISQGLRNNVISGVIYGGKDVSPDNLRLKLTDIRDNFPKAGRLFDPQHYVSLYTSEPNIKLGSLEDYPYFNPLRRSQLEDSQFVSEQILRVLEFQVSLPVSHIIAPNIYISNSFDSVESVVAKNFIRKSMEIYKTFRDPRPLLTTLAVSKDALIKDQNEFESFLNDVTVLDLPPDGFYLLVGARNVSGITEIFNTDTISTWMLLNFALKSNNFLVVNGYSDSVSPFLGAAGGDIGCTGWWSNLRRFSIERWLPEITMGRQPVPRYLSTKLLNRISFDEFNRLKRIIPEIVNGLPTDRAYENEPPDRVEEILQSWDALNALLVSLTNNDVLENINRCLGVIERAESLYAAIAASYAVLDPKSANNHLDPLREGIILFREKAEI